MPLLQFGEEDAWTLQDSFEGTFILGSIGSGKTSGSGRALAEAFLSSGYGGLVLTVKEDERRLWEHYARKTGREHHLCVVEPGGRWRLNFLDYELRRPELGAGLIENIVHLFYTAVHSRSHDPSIADLAEFWDHAGKQLLRNLFRVLEGSREQLTLSDARKMISQAPGSLEELKAKNWEGTDFGCWLHWATEAAKGTPEEETMGDVRKFWLDEFPKLAPNTRSCIITGFTAMCEAFVEPSVRDLFCTDTTLAPDAVLDGAIIVVDLPVKRYQDVGVFAQNIWKHLFQKAVERRSDALNASRRPCFLWADEAQYFFSNYDSLFQSTARSSRCATVYITQNLPNFYASAGRNSHDRVDGFLGNLNTKIFHSNNDPASNRWAAEQIGRCKTYRMSTSSSTTTNTGKGIWGWLFPSTTYGGGTQEVIDYEVQPSEFMKLRTGSEDYDRLVDAIVVQGGAQFRATGKHFLQTVFQQEAL